MSGKKVSKVTNEIADVQNNMMLYGIPIERHSIPFGMAIIIKHKYPQIKINDLGVVLHFDFSEKFIGSNKIDLDTIDEDNINDTIDEDSREDIIDEEIAYQRCETCEKMKPFCQFVFTYLDGRMVYSPKRCKQCRKIVREERAEYQRHIEKKSKRSILKKSNSNTSK